MNKIWLIGLMILVMVLLSGCFQDDRINQLESNIMDTLEDKFSELQSKLEELKDEIDSKLDDLESKIDEVESKVDDIELNIS